MTLQPGPRRAITAVWLATAVGLIAAASPPPAALPQPVGAATPGEPVRIVPIGDSITQGGGREPKEYTYRLPLARMLQDDGVCVDFVGTHRAGATPMTRWPADFDADNEGYYGAKTATVRDHLRQTLPTLAPPDVALVHLGTNDGEGSVDADIVAPMREIVALLRQANPRIVILIAQIKTNWRQSAYLHFRIGQLAREASTANSPLVTVDQHTGWSVDPNRADADTFDGVHPNLHGQRKMAEAWLAALRPYLAARDGGHAACAPPTPPDRSALRIPAATPAASSAD